MGLFDSLFASSATNKASNVQEINTKQKRDADRSVEQQSSSTQTSAQTSAQQSTSGQQQTQTSLDQETQNVLRQLVQSLGIGVSGDAGVGSQASAGALDFAQFLGDRAKGTQDFVDARKQNIVGEARRQGEDELTSLVTQSSRQAGSSLNTLVTDVASRGRAELESRLGALTGQLDLSGRQLEDQSLAAAFSSLIEAGQLGQSVKSSDVTNLSNLAGILKGSEISSDVVGQVNVAGSAQETTTIDQVSKLIELINEITKTTGTVTNTGKSYGTASPGIIPGILDAAGSIASLGG